MAYLAALAGLGSLPRAGRTELPLVGCDLELVASTRHYGPDGLLVWSDWIERSDLTTDHDQLGRVGQVLLHVLLAERVDQTKQVR